MRIIELKCPKCGAPVSSDKNVCHYCGAKYVVVGESDAFVFGKYLECSTFRHLQKLKKRIQSVEKRNVYDMEEVKEMRKTVEGKACKLCHIKNCPFFNQEFYKMFKRMFPNKSLELPSLEEIDKKIGNAYRTDELQHLQ